MTFDEQVRRAVDTLTERLHDDVRREVEIAVEEVSVAHSVREAELTREIDAIRASVTAEIEAARRSAARETEEAREALVREKDAAVALRAEQAATAARVIAAAEAGDVAQGTQSSAARRLLDAVRSIGRARSLSETLDTLASSAAREAERVAVLTVRAGELRGWRFLGFEALDRDPAADVPFDDRGLSDRARESRVVVNDELRSAIPIAIGGEVVAVLYADAGDSTPAPRQAPGTLSSSKGDARIPNPGTLEILARHAERTLEALVAFKAARALTSVPGGPDDDGNVELKT